MHWKSNYWKSWKSLIIVAKYFVRGNCDIRIGSKVLDIKFDGVKEKYDRQ